MELEERRSPRKKLTSYPELIDCESGQRIGRVVDLSVGGLKAVGRPVVPHSPALRLKMVLPTNRFGLREVFFDAESVWTSSDGNPEYDDTGFKITRIDQRSMRLLDLLRHRQSFRN